MITIKIPKLTYYNYNGFGFNSQPDRLSVLSILIPKLILKNIFTPRRVKTRLLKAIEK